MNGQPSLGIYHTFSDRGRPARNAPQARRFALRAHCGRDARGPETSSPLDKLLEVEPHTETYLARAQGAGGYKEGIEEGLALLRGRVGS